MDPVNFEHSNIILGPPEGMTEDQVRSIFAFGGQGKGGHPVFITRWKPTAEELNDLALGGSVWLFVYGPSFPPVFMTTKDPFPKEPT